MGLAAIAMLAKLGVLLPVAAGGGFAITLTVLAVAGIARQR